VQKAAKYNFYIQSLESEVHLRQSIKKKDTESSQFYRTFGTDRLKAKFSISWETTGFIGLVAAFTRDYSNKNTEMFLYSM
jgi:hypothetical protein